MLIFKDISLRVAGRLLIESASISLADGAKIGFVGHNGTGKTSLFRAIGGAIALERGEIILPQRARIGEVAQEAPATDLSLIDIVLAADTERAYLLEEAATTQDATRIGDIHTRLADIDAHSAPARAATILAGLGFDEAAQKHAVSTLSGGWRMRVALACVLFSRPDILLLDEPTNYLDLEGTIWLQDYLRHYPASVLMISHDRDLLNKTVTSILHLENKQLKLWRGNYDQFEHQRSEALILQQKQATKQQAHRAHMQAFVDRFRAKATKARQAQSRLKALERLAPITLWQEETVMPITFPAIDKSISSPIVVLSEVNVGYEPQKPILQNLNLRLDHDDRIALLGANGNGKSTFAKLLAGRLVPSQGKITLAPGLRVAFFAQHQMEDLRPRENAIEHLRRLLPLEPEAKLRARIAQMGLATAKMLTQAQDLSGGEKARLLLGLATYDRPHLLILDEPTNHLDMDSRAALIEALNEFNGAVLLIAHDRHLIDATAERLWLVNQGTITPFDGDLEDYQAHILQRPVERSNQNASSRETQRRLEAQKRLRLAPLRKQIQAMETQIDNLQSQIAMLDEILLDEKLYVENPAKAMKKAQERGQKQKALMQAEQHWLDLSEQYEAALSEI